MFYSVFKMSKFSTRASALPSSTTPLTPSRSTSPSTACNAFVYHRFLIREITLFMQAGLYEKPKVSRKQRKERKNRQKKIRGKGKYAAQT